MFEASLLLSNKRIPKFDNSLVLLFDELNGSIVTRDVTKTYAFSRGAGNGQITSGAGRNGKSGLVLNGDGYFFAPYDSFFDLGNNDFTIETWMKSISMINAFPIFHRTLDHYGGYSYTFQLLNNNEPEFYYTLDGSHSSGIRSVRYTGFNYNTWTHLAISRVGSVIRVYINGTAVSSVVADTIHSTSDIGVFIGGDSGHLGTTSYSGTGVIDSLRFINGVGLYVDNFTPPSGFI